MATSSSQGSGSSPEPPVAQRASLLPPCYTAGKKKRKEERSKQDKANGNRNQKDTKDTKSGPKRRKGKQKGTMVPMTSASPVQ